MISEYQTIIKEAFKIRERNALELLLVTKGIKRGDLLDSFLFSDRKPLLKKLTELIDLGAPLDFFKASDLLEDEDPSTGKKVFYYNIQLATSEEIAFFKQTIKEQRAGKVEMGWFYGIPDCCIKAYPSDCIEELPEFTEWRWCSTDCSESLRLQTEYKRVIQEYFPEIKSFSF